MRTWLLRFWSMVAVLAICAGSATRAQTLNSYDRGWHTDFGMHVADNDNYFVGNGGSWDYHNWFLFNIPVPAPGNIYVGASLRVFLTEVESNSPFLTYALRDYKGSIAELRQDSGSGVPGTTVYEDLGNGADYGSIDVSSSSTNVFLTITLTQSALNDINGSWGKDLAIGGLVTSQPSGTSPLGRLFAQSETGNPADGRTQLILVQDMGSLPAPEPSTISLLAVAGFACSNMIRKRYARQKLK